MSSPATQPVDPPGPSRSELWGARHRLGANPLPDWVEWQKRFGDVVLVDLGVERFYFVFHPRDIEYVMRSNHRNYIRETPAVDVLRLLQGYGLATVTGKPWARQRALLNPLFLDRRVDSYAPFMAEMVADFLKGWEEPAAAGEVIDLVAHMVSLAIRVGAGVLVSTDLKDQLPEMEGLIRVLQRVASRRLQAPVKLPMWVPTPEHLRFKKALARMDEMIYAVIQERRASGGDQDDVLGRLLKVRDPETGAPLSDLELRDQVMTIAGAAHDTTGLGLTWTFYLLARHPEVYRRLLAEVDASLGGRMPGAADLPAMPWAHQVLEEVLRLYPPIYTLMRRVEEDDEIRGYRIRKGSYMLAAMYVAHRHPDFWEDPERFDPARFEPGSRDRIDPYAYFPFGAGPHVCIGKPFALLDTQLILAGICSRYRLELEPPDFVPPVQAGFSFRPAGEVPVRLHRRVPGNDSA